LTEIRFTQAARKLRVGRDRARHVIAHPVVVLNLAVPAEGMDERIVYLGDDKTGRALEVVAVATETGLLVIHVQDLQAKFRRYYDEAKEQR